MKRRTIYLHQKNPVSFCYGRNKLSKPKFEAFVQSKDQEDHPTMIHEDRSAYLHFIKNGLYHTTENQCFTYCSASDIHKSYFQFDQIYHYLMQNLRLNFVNLENQYSDTSVECLQKPIRSITSTFYPEDSLELNDQDYYEVWIKGKHKPLYLGLNTRLYDDNGNQKTLLDIVYRLSGQKRLLGLSSQHQLTTYQIERIRNLNREDEPIDELDTPFYSFEIESQCRLPLLVNHILVDLD